MYLELGDRMLKYTDTGAVIREDYKGSEEKVVEALISDRDAGPRRVQVSVEGSRVVARVAAIRRLTC